jgi:hypothetical protein
MVFSMQPRGQSNGISKIINVDSAPWIFNFGIGRGFGEATDAWTVK